jgi:hypothetical protein
MAYLPLNIPPGVFRNGTAYQAKGRWYDANLVRWKDGQMRPIGGWQKITPSAFEGKVRGLLSWRDNGGQRRWLAAGTSAKLYSYNNDAFVDITPEDFPAGRDTGVYGNGYGAYTYGAEAYGTERPQSGLVLDASTWSMDTWGENLVAVATHEGNLYEWAPDETEPIALPEIIANAPTQNRALIVTEERHLVALGAGGNPRKVAWSSQEDNTLWAAAATNTAGDIELVTPGILQSGRRLPGQIMLWTDTDAHVMRYVGPPFIYGFERVGSGCGLAGPNAHMGFGNACAWMGDKNFFMFDGVVKPLESDVNDYVFSDINLFQAAKITAGHLSELGEIWWFYPSKNSTENDRYVIWNYREGHWTIGNLPRTSWLDVGAYPYPIAAGVDNNLYQHEQGWTNNGVTRVGQVFAKSAPLELGDGDQLMAVRQLIPDGCPNVPTCTRVSFEVQQTPLGPATTYGPYQFTRSDGYADARFTGRQVELTVEATRDAPFRFGKMRLDAVAGSGR